MLIPFRILWVLEVVRSLKIILLDLIQVQPLPFFITDGDALIIWGLDLFIIGVIIELIPIIGIILVTDITDHGVIGNCLLTRSHNALGSCFFDCLSSLLARWEIV